MIPRTHSAIVIYGGYGVFGRLVAEDLLQQTDARLVIAGRNRTRLQQCAGELGERVTAIVSDIADIESVRRAIRDAAAVICCAGPFQRLPLNLLRAAIECRVPYADIADSRAYVQSVYDLEGEILAANIPVLTGLSTTPGTSSIFVKLASQSIDQIDAVNIALFMGNKNQKGEGAIRSLLGNLGDAIRVPRRDGWETVRVWEGRELVDFPQPVGRQPVYWFDVPDYDLLPRYFKAKTVTFKCGFDLDFINRALACLRAAKLLTGYSIERRAKALILLSNVVAGLGKGQGMFRVEVVGTSGGQPKRFVGTIRADVRGQRVAAVPAAVAGAALWRRGIRRGGILPMYEWIEPESYADQLKRRGFHCDFQLD